MCSTSSSLHYKRGSNSVPPPSLQSLLHRRCWASHTWPNKCSCLVRLSIAPWTRAIRSSSDVTGASYTILFNYHIVNSREVSDLVIKELVPLYIFIALDYVIWGVSGHFYQNPQMAKGLHTCCIRLPKRFGTNCDTRSFSNFRRSTAAKPLVSGQGFLLEQ